MAEKRRATTFRTSRGAIVNVAYPDIYIAPGVKPEDVINPAELREELARSGIMWYVGSSEYEMARLQAMGVPFTRADMPKPNIVWDSRIVQKLPNGNYLLVDHATDQVIEVTPDWDVVWEYGGFLVRATSVGNVTYLYDPHKAIYNPDTNRVLISEEVLGRVLEVDYATKAVTNVLTSTARGALKGRTTASYGRNGIIIASPYDHWVAEVAWNGTILWEFGVYGVSGTDLTHLHGPSDAMYDFLHQTYLICDGLRGDNNRVLAVQADGTVRKWYPALYPWHISMSRSGLVCISSVCDVSYVIEWWGHIYYWAPSRSDFIVLTDDYTMMWNWEHQAFELDLRTWRPWRKPNDLAFSYTLGVNASSPTLPIHAFACKEPPSIYARSTQAATLEIYAWNPVVEVARDVTGAGDVVPATPWYLYDSVTMAAGTLVNYTPTGRMPFVGVRVTMGGVAGTARIWWHERWES